MPTCLPTNPPYAGRRGSVGSEVDEVSGLQRSRRGNATVATGHAIQRHPVSWYGAVEGERTHRGAQGGRSGGAEDGPCSRGHQRRGKPAGHADDGAADDRRDANLRNGVRSSGRVRVAAGGGAVVLPSGVEEQAWKGAIKHRTGHTPQHKDMHCHPPHGPCCGASNADR